MAAATRRASYLGSGRNDDQVLTGQGVLARHADTAYTIYEAT